MKLTLGFQLGRGAGAGVDRGQIAALEGADAGEVAASVDGPACRNSLNALSAR